MANSPTISIRTLVAVIALCVGIAAFVIEHTSGLAATAVVRAESAKTDKEHDARLADVEKWVAVMQAEARHIREELEKQTRLMEQLMNRERER